MCSVLLWVSGIQIVGFLIFAQTFSFHFFPFCVLHDYYKGLSIFRNDKMLVVIFGRSYFMTSSQKIRTEQCYLLNRFIF